MTNQMVDEMFDKAARQCDSSGKVLYEDVIRLQEWLDTQKHLPKMLDQHGLRNFIILNKCSIEIAKQKIDNYYTVRSKLPEIFDEINPEFPYHKKLNDFVYFVEHPQLTDEMHKIYFFKVKGETVSENFHPVDVVKKFVTMLEMRLREDIMFGDIAVFDLKGVTLSAALKCTPTLIYKSLILLYQRVVSNRLKAVHIINMSPALTKILLTIKSILTPKLSERIYVHPEVDALKKVIPLDLLPVDFGGEGLSLQELEDALESRYAKNQELFDRLDEIKVNEYLRPEKLEDDETLGFYGNFKKLDID